MRTNWANEAAEGGGGGGRRCCLELSSVSWIWKCLAATVSGSQRPRPFLPPSSSKRRLQANCATPWLASAWSLPAFSSGCRSCCLNIYAFDIFVTRTGQRVVPRTSIKKLYAKSKLHVRQQQTTTRIIWIYVYLMCFLHWPPTVPGNLLSAGPPPGSPWDSHTPGIDVCWAFNP